MIKLKDILKEEKKLTEASEKEFVRRKAEHEQLGIILYRIAEKRQKGTFLAKILKKYLTDLKKIKK